MKVVALSQAHFGAFCQWHADANFNLMASWDSRPKSFEDISASYGRFMAIPNIGLVAESEEGRAMAGFFAEIDYRIRSAEIHIAAAPGDQMKNAAAVLQVTDCGLSILFGDYGLSSVRFRTLSVNSRLRECAESYGFQYRGLFRDAVFINGHTCDMVLYDMLQSEFLAKLKKGE